MNNELKMKIIKIIDELPSENSCLDYKEIPYKEDKIHELIKDLCSFLNSEEAYGKDKYIIIGVTDDKDAIGIKAIPMQDDRFYQSAADYIFPRPSIESGIIKHKVNGKNLDFGYIYISKDNVDRIYEIKQDYYYKKDKNSYTLDQSFQKIVCASTAWIRRGSCKRILDEHTRREIYKQEFLKKSFSLNRESEYTHSNASANIKILKTALLFGKWNENNENDKRIIEKYVDIDYDKFIEQFRLIAKTEKDFEFKNGIWKINKRRNHFEYNILDFYKEDLDIFNLLIVEILNEKHPKLDLSSDKRNMYKIYNKFTKYSEEMRSGVAETLVVVESLKNKFENCKVSSSNFGILVVREILNNSDWSTWASLDQLLPYLAETSPDEFLNQFKDYLSRDKKCKLVSEKEDGIITYNYLNSIYWSLELIAWNTDNFIQSGMILSVLANFDEKAIDHIVSLVLPWYPNTYAPIEFRVTLVENILKESINIGWRVIKKLMPGETLYTVPTYKPRYINIPSEKMTVTNEEYYNQVDSYLDLMIKYCKNNDGRLIDLIDLLDNVSKENFDKICEVLKSPKIIRKSDSSKYKLWDKLEKLVYWIKKYSDFKKEIKKEMIEKIESVIEYIKPKNNLYIVSRLFKKDTWDLIEEHDNYEFSEKKLNELRLNAIKEIYSKNDFKAILKLVDIVEDSYSLGMILSKINLPLSEEKDIIFSNLDKKEKLCSFAKGYVYNKYNLNGIKYNMDTLKGLPIKSKINFLLMLPYNMDTFKNVEILLEADYNKYWRQVDIRFLNDEKTLSYCVDKLMKVNRFERVLWMYRLSLHYNNNLTYNNDIVLTCLEKIKKNFDQIDICEAIVELQKNNADKDRLFYIEWKFLPLLNYGDYRPITMEKEIAADPSRYAEILELAFKEHSKSNNNRKKDSNIATNAYRLLYQWKYVPGTKKDGFINGSDLKKWYNEMKEICAKIDRLEVGLFHFGNVLFYSSKDKSDFWIDKTAAEIINNDKVVRRGYINEAVNSLGAVNWDENGTVYLSKRDEYQQKTKDTELAGYYNFATALRKVAQDFELDAEHMKDTYHDF